MNILLVFATEKEAALVGSIPQNGGYVEGISVSDHRIQVCITGVGGASTAWSLMNWFSLHGRPDIAINAGIAGSFNRQLKPGDVVMPQSDLFADAGIEIDSHFQTLFEYGLAAEDEPPFENGLLVSRNIYTDKLAGIVKTARAVTVNMASGSQSSIKKIKGKFNPDIETMEGATFFYICGREKVPFLALRAISNYVEPGKRGKWEIPLALERLREKVIEILQIL